MKKKVDQKEFDFKGFVNVNLNVETKAAFKAWDCTEVEKYNLTSAALVLGYKVSSSFDKHNSAFTVSMTCRDVENPNYGYTLTARAGDLYTAELLLFFKHVVMLEQVWTNYEPSDDDVLG